MTVDATYYADEAHDTKPPGGGDYDLYLTPSLLLCMQLLQNGGADVFMTIALKHALYCPVPVDSATFSLKRPVV